MTESNELKALKNTIQVAAINAGAAVRQELASVVLADLKMMLEMKTRSGVSLAFAALGGKVKTLMELGLLSAQEGLEAYTEVTEAFKCHLSTLGVEDGPAH